MSKLKFIHFNANPWQKLRPDCSIRAIAAALNMAYTDVCKKLNVSYKLGYGMIRNEGAAEVERLFEVFDPYFDNSYIDSSYMDNFNEIVSGTGEYYNFADFDDPDMKSFEDDFIDPDVGSSLEEFIDEQGFAEGSNKGRFIFVMRPSKKEFRKMGLDWHSIYINTKNMYYLDQDFSDEGIDYRKDAVVAAWAKIKDSKVLKNDDPNSLYTEFNLVNAGFRWGKEKPSYLTTKEWAKYQEQVKRGDTSRRFIFSQNADKKWLALKLKK